MMEVRLHMHRINTFSWRACVVGVLLSLCFLVATRGQAIDPVEELQAQINETNRMLEMSVNATKPLESEVKALSARIQAALKNIAGLQAEQKQRATDISKQEKEMAGQYELFTNRVDLQYRFARTNSPLVTLLTASRGSNGLQALKYTLTLAERDRQTIDSIGANIVSLQEAKVEAAKKEQQLASLQAQLNKQKASFEKDIAGAKQYQTELQSKIAALSAQQQAVISARSGSYITSAGAVPTSGDIDSTIAGFRQNAPANTFAVFTFGAHTHRNGMSQYGAKARAEAGQNYKEILSAYYGKEPTQKDTGGNISVSGVGSLEFETKYLYGIAEMPDTWSKEALKAQAVAARSYAYINYKEKGKEICTTESCQAFRKSKSDNPPQAWKEAVDETKGMILEGVSTQYSAISGGYLNTSGWDTADKSNSGDWTSRAWEVKANAPWFYKAWYRQVLPGSYSDSNNPCGRKPWMSQEEMSDIVNAYFVMKVDSRGADTGRILPVTINSCAVGGQSGNPYSMEELRKYVDNPVTNISGVTVSNNNQGQTTEVRFQTNRGEVKISGNDFKEVFNTRAPGFLAIHQKNFAFFNIEKK